VLGLSGATSRRSVLASAERPGLEFSYRSSTRGLDVGAKEEVYNSFAGLTGEGLSIVLTSDNFGGDHRLTYSVLVMRERRRLRIGPDAARGAKPTDRPHRRYGLAMAVKRCGPRHI